MSRFTSKHARQAAERIRVAHGAPSLEYTPREHGHGNACAVGAIYLEPGSANCGIAWKICQTVNDSGAERVILSAVSAHDLVTQANGYLDGYYAGRKAAAPVVRAVLDRLAAHNFRGNADEAHVFDAARAFLAGVQP